MSRNSEQVKTWRRNTKARIIASMGGSCVVCSYNKCQSSLALHHLDPAKKDFSLGSIRANIRSWALIVQELKKCVLVCHNCHGEIHEGITNLNEGCLKFNNDYENYNTNPNVVGFKEKYRLSPCLACGKDKPAYKKYCSQSCASKSMQKINWDSVNLIEEMKTKSVVKIAEELGCSDAAIHKKLRKMGLK